MPTSPRDLTGGTGWYLTTRPVVGPSGPMKGIGPYARGKPLPSIVPRPLSIGVPSTPVPGFARSTLSKQERAPHPSRLTACHLPRGGRRPPAGVSPYLPLGEGAAAAAEEGRYQVGSAYRPTPVRASPCHPLPGEGFSLIRHALRRATFPVGEGILRRGYFLTFPLAFQTIFPFTPFTNPLLCCKIGSSSQKLWEVWS